MSEEQRLHPRFEVNQLVELDAGRETFVRAHAANLSRGGILCETDEECELHSTVFIMMTLSLNEGDRIIKCEGVIVRSEPDGDHWETGISITSMDDASAVIFDEFLAQRNE
jgi:hypothetical protein